MKPLVSILTPTYQSQRHIGGTIRSVQRQTYSNWELIIADDCSTDETRRIVNRAAEEDSRIRLVSLPENRGAARARNAALREASGKYIAYLDADDLWMPDKLEQQVGFMEKRDCAFSCVSYRVISDGGRLLNKTVHMKPCLDYKGFLLHNLIQTVGVMANREAIPAALLEMPDMRRRQDAATWMQILKGGFSCYGIWEPLAYYRRAKGSLSSSKWDSVKGTWRLYRKVERLSLHLSVWCFMRYAMLAVWKRLYWPALPGRSDR